jgi:hypothetical protein
MYPLDSPLSLGGFEIELAELLVSGKAGFCRLVILRIVGESQKPNIYFFSHQECLSPCFLPNKNQVHLSRLILVHFRKCWNFFWSLLLCSILLILCLQLLTFISFYCLCHKDSVISFYNILMRVKQQHSNFSHLQFFSLLISFTNT